MSSSKILNYGVDLYRLRVNPGGFIEVNVSNGEFRVDGNLTTTDNIITLNVGESGSVVSRVVSGIDIDRGTGLNARLLFDETRNGTNGPGAFTLTNESGQFESVYTNGVYTSGNQNLFLLGPDSTGSIIVNSVDYEKTVFPYDELGRITAVGLSTPAEPSALVSAKSLVDYIQSYFEFNLVNILEFSQIQAVGDPSVRVVAESTPEKRVRVLVDNIQTAIFTEEKTDLTKLLVSEEIISSDGEDLVLNPSLNVAVSGKRIIALADPVDNTDAVNKQFLENTLVEQLGALLAIDTENVPTGAVLVYNADLSQFIPEPVLNNQIIDAGVF